MRTNNQGRAYVGGHITSFTHRLPLLLQPWASLHTGTLPSPLFRMGRVLETTTLLYSHFAILCSFLSIALQSMKPRGRNLSFSPTVMCHPLLWAPAATSRKFRKAIALICSPYINISYTVSFFDGGLKNLRCSHKFLSSCSYDCNLTDQCCSGRVSRDCGGRE